MMQTLRPHDLIHVHLKGDWFTFEDDADEAFAHLSSCPLVVVRRGTTRGDMIPIGVRGRSRSERYAGWLHPDAISRIARPADLLRQTKDLRHPVFQALDELVHRWHGFNLHWGPTGSAGFELASGVANVTGSSDLDIQVRAEEPFAKDHAQRLLEAASSLPAAVDILVETPLGGFALTEYVAHAACMLRTDRGPLLVTDPWRPMEAAA